MTIKVEVEFVGVLQKLAGKRTASLEFEDPVAVEDVIRELSNLFPSEFKQFLIDPELDDPRPNVLVLLNKKEVGVLDGLTTRVNDGSQVVLIPVSHGG